MRKRLSLSLFIWVCIAGGVLAFQAPSQPGAAGPALLAQAAPVPPAAPVDRVAEPPRPTPEVVQQMLGLEQQARSMICYYGRVSRPALAEVRQPLKIVAVSVRVPASAR